MKKLFFAFFLLPCFLVKAQSSKAKVHINHTAIFVVDLKRSGDFYQNIIGLDTIAEPFHDGRHLWLKTGEHAALHIIQGADKPREYFKNQHTCFSVPNFMSFVENLRKASLKFEDVSGKPNTYSSRVDGIHQLWLQDPDGYWIEINDDPS
jgi:lactoylglutathione lyase